MRTDLVSQYLKNVAGNKPLTIEQIDMMLHLVGAARESVTTFLDLGCKDGVLSAAMLDECTGATGVLIETSPSHTQAARLRLRAQEDRVRFLKTDVATPRWLESVRDLAPFDVVVSGFAISHLHDERKKALFEELLPLLSDDGLFLNIEDVASATRWTESVWDDTLIHALFGSVIQESPGKPRAEVAKEYYDRAKLAGEYRAPLEVQLEWLREAGFVNVECFLKVLELALFGGQKSGARALA